MRRIVEETLADGTKQYRVETNKTLFGLITTKWHTDTVFIVGDGWDANVPAVFDTLEQAEIHVYGKKKSKEVVSRKVL